MIVSLPARCTVALALFAATVAPSVTEAVPGPIAVPLIIPQTSQPDSQAIAKGVRAAQSRFERIHRNALPYSSRTGGGRCDVRVGRFCYWHDDDDSWLQHDESDKVVRERERLQQLLDSAAASLPGDRWIAGQRVRYLIEVGRLDAALKVTRRCGADYWWCRALEGYALHVTGDYASADAAFASSIAAMPPEQACEWRDILLLLEGKSRGTYDDLDCEERTDFENRFWWLSDPLFTVPGNERRTEHYSRVVVGKLLEESDSPRRARWGNDSRELLYRYGRIIGWERSSSSRLSTTADFSVLGHHRNHSWHFEPRDEYLRDNRAITPGSWDLESYRPHARYAAEYATQFHPLDHVLSVFRADDSAVVVVRCATPESGVSPVSEGAATYGQFESALVLAPSETGRTRVSRGLDCAPQAITVPFVPTLVSVEALSRSDSVAARDRYWLDIPQRVAPDSTLAISDLLPLEAVDELPVDLEGAVPLALASTSMQSADEMGLYWEVYGLDPAWTSVKISLSVEKVGKGVFRRVGEWAGVVGKRSDRIRMEWIEQLLPTTTLERAIALRLTPDMDGTYTMQLAVRAPNGETAVTTRLIEVTPSG